MKKETKERLKEYSTGLKTLQKVIKVLAEKDIYYFAAGHHTDTAIQVKTNRSLNTFFKVIKTEVTEDLIYTFIDVDGEIVRIIQ
jgi:hypothetical protein